MTPASTAPWAATPWTRPIVGMAATADGGGYWVVASDGGIFAFGDAHFYGSIGGHRLTRPWWAWPSTPPPAATGRWPPTAASSPSTPRFLGSTGEHRLTQPVVGMQARPNGRGYRLVAADGGIFAFGARTTAPRGGSRLTQPVVGMTGF